ncbi:MAG: SMC-Scp complex subunit ScpB [archaeon]
MVSSKTLQEIDEAKEKESMKKLEAVFFISGRYLTMQQLISYTDLNPIIIRDLIERLKDKYEAQDSAIQIIEKSEMWKMDVRSEYSDIINRLATGSSEFTKAEQETLAIIAFKQPMKQSVLIKIRGNKAYDHIKKFVDLNLIKKKKMGHTYELTLSEEFYDYFGVSEGQTPKEMVEDAKNSQANFGATKSQDRASARNTEKDFVGMSKKEKEEKIIEDQ